LDVRLFRRFRAVSGLFGRFPGFSEGIGRRSEGAVQGGSTVDSVDAGDGFGDPERIKSVSRAEAGIDAPPPSRAPSPPLARRRGMRGSRWQRSKSVHSLHYAESEVNRSGRLGQGNRANGRIEPRTSRTSRIGPGRRLRKRGHTRTKKVGFVIFVRFVVNISTFGQGPFA
jgi:hypothetical protein